MLKKFGGPSDTRPCPSIDGDINNCATSIPPASFTLNMARRSDGFIAMFGSDEMSIALVSMNVDGPGVEPCPYVDLPAPFVNGPLGGGEVILADAPERSRKASDGEKASGLLCCEVVSFEALDRRVFLRTGRIHGGRGLADVSGRGDSSGIWVTETRNKVDGKGYTKIGFCTHDDKTLPLGLPSEDHRCSVR